MCQNVVMTTNTRSPHLPKDRTQDEITREKRLRNAAKRQGLNITRSRVRDPRALMYGRYQITRRAVPGAHWRGGEVVAGEGIGLTIDEVETYLLGDVPERHEQTR